MVKIIKEYAVIIIYLGYYNSSLNRIRSSWYFKNQLIRDVNNSKITEKHVSIIISWVFSVLCYCNQNDIESRINRYEKIDLMQFENWQIFPREDGSMYYMVYSLVSKDSAENLRRIKTLLYIPIEKSGCNIISSLDHISDSDVIFFCREHKISIFLFKEYIHDLFKIVITNKLKSVENLGGITIIKDEKYTIINSKGNANRILILNNNSIEFKNNTSLSFMPQSYRNLTAHVLLIDF